MDANQRVCGPCSRGQHAPCDGPNEFWGDCLCSCNAPEKQCGPSETKPTSIMRGVVSDGQFQPTSSWESL